MVSNEEAEGPTSLPPPSPLPNPRAERELLRVENLCASFRTENGSTQVLSGVSFSVREGEIVALVGESGSGKSVTSLSLMRLLPEEGSNNGRVFFDGTNTSELSESKMRQLRGSGMAMVFQEPMTSLNPVFTVGFQIAEAIRIHRSVSRTAARTRVLELLKLVKIPSPESNIDAYPHQLSGGMRQRVMIAMALGCEPKLLIADEPTTALDVTIQAQILELLRDLRERLGLSILLVTHDLGIVAEYTDRVLVMYAGQIIEEGAVRDVFAQPKHPYTRGLLGSLPVMGRGQRRLVTIPGVVPAPSAYPKGCRFAARCELCEPACEAEMPAHVTVGPEHLARCRRWKDVS